MKERVWERERVCVWVHSCVCVCVCVVAIGGPCIAVRCRVPIGLRLVCGLMLQGSWPGGLHQPFVQQGVHVPGRSGATWLAVPLTASWCFAVLGRHHLLLQLQAISPQEEEKLSLPSQRVGSYLRRECLAGGGVKGWCDVISCSGLAVVCRCWGLVPRRLKGIWRGTLSSTSSFWVRQLLATVSGKDCRIIELIKTGRAGSLCPNVWWLKYLASVAEDAV